LALAICSALLTSACSDNANLSLQLSQATSVADKLTGVIIYSGYSFQIVRVEINGVKYLCNTKGGIIRE
jgi:hypothetical protein